MKETLLFSDVHLKPLAQEDALYKEFIAFLKHIKPETVDRVICLGDLFDFWFEYRHACFASYFEVLRLLAGLREAGIETHLICGNHDLWAGKQLERLTGMRIHRDSVRLPFGEDEALLLHGDGLNRQDYGYRLFKCIARNRLAQGLFRRLHPDTAMAVAQRLSHKSRTMKQAQYPGESPENRAIRDHARHLIGMGAAKIVICGHSHVPAIESMEEKGVSGLYVNPGDWPLNRSYICFSGQEFRLQTFC